MKLQDLTCNQCGAPLKVAESANYVTCTHCSTQLAVRRTDHVAFTEQLDRLAEKTEHLSDRLDDLSSHSALASLDRQWQMDRGKFAINDKQGHPRLPTEGGAIGGGIMMTVFGCLWTALAVGITSGAPNMGPFVVAKFAFPLFGICFIIAGLATSVRQYAKAGEYRRAERQYRRQRAELLARDDASGDRSR